MEGITFLWLTLARHSQETVSWGLSIEVTHRLSFKDLFIFFGRRMHTCRISLKKWRCSSLMVCLDQWRSGQRARSQTDELREVKGHVYTIDSDVDMHKVMRSCIFCVWSWRTHLPGLESYMYRCEKLYTYTVGECISSISCTNNSLLSETTQPTSKYYPIRNTGCSVTLSSKTIVFTNMLKKFSISEF